MKKNQLSRYEIIRLRRDIQHQLSAEELDTLISALYLSISEEAKASADYRSLSDLAPDSLARQSFIEFSQDQEEQAAQLQFIYESISGKLYAPPGEEETEIKIGNYREALENRVLEETRSYQKFTNYYQLTESSLLKGIFANLLQVKSYHLSREMYFLHTETTKMFDLSELTKRISQLEGIKDEIKRIEEMTIEIREVELIKEELKKLQEMKEELKQVEDIRNEMKEVKRESRKMLKELQEGLNKMSRRSKVK